MGVLGRIHSVETFGAADGPGIRYVVFTQGCPLRCLYCHNPDSHNFAGGTEISSEKIAKDIAEYKDYYTDGGVTVSGGEPLSQADFTADILRRCREMKLHTAIDTSGGVSPEHAENALVQADLVIIDVKAAEERLALELTGHGLENTKKTLDWCEKSRKPMWIRQVQVPEITLVESQLNALGELLCGYKTIERVELLAFHKMGEYKWKQLGLDYRLTDVKPPSVNQMKNAREILSKKLLNIPVK